ncbi:MAG: 50S ribosomal protein L35ae [Nanoarchaeota archaeon]|nr:50S ribosomal protein L35ae [Nanoarchaeota archaeon]MBU4242376.1 50S ribosomal protein L35ae [Nanoarchaeota archaeon]MBU4352120.1 50S ribosomal protein L35ae [Nanoarchaeota archaeon]MBU4455894.1 50S ribosomal protein L35ae [Nanoarchaeota archaeon]MCG2720231.1 50S ribosomal protein L35ae [Nanoarchaeota archaeon]
MEAIVANFRRGKKTQKLKHMILKVASIDNKTKATKLVGKKVVWTSPAGKKLHGEIKAVHGNSGAVRAIFEHGLPGQSIGTKIKIEA